MMICGGFDIKIIYAEIVLSMLFSVVGSYGL